jgi:hypothetical protein
MVGHVAAEIAMNLPKVCQQPRAGSGLLDHAKPCREVSCQLVLFGFGQTQKIRPCLDVMLIKRVMKLAGRKYPQVQGFVFGEL